VYWARRLGVTDADTADLLQEVFVVLVRRLPEWSYDASGSFRAWLRAIFVNKWREGQRRDARQITLGSAAVEVPEAGPRAEAEEWEYRRFVLQGALRILEAEFSPTHWRAFLLYALEGQPVDEVAASTGLSVNAVYLVKSRALRRLHQEVDELTA